VAERPRVLERAGDAALDHVPGTQPGDVLAVEHDAPRVRAQDLGDEPQQRGLAGAVRADQADDLVALELEAHRVHGGQAAEALVICSTRKSRSHDPVYRFVPEGDLNAA
jgi:hypothetical protein